MGVLPPPTAPLALLPAQPDGVAWPTTEWPVADLSDGVAEEPLTAAFEAMFGPDPDPVFGESYAGIVVHRGRVVVERYGDGTDASSPLLSWSMAKSITHALVGILTAEGRLDPAAPAAVPEWSDPADPRHAITLHQLLRMVDGLDFNEDYALPEGDEKAERFSHCIDMLFGAGKDDHAAYAADRPPIAAPDTRFNYSSGTSNIVARIVGDRIGRGDDAAAWMHEHLFDPIGMTSATPSFDTAGTFVGSSYVHATARDYARFGLLYLRGGTWDDRSLVPATWVDDGRTPRAVDDADGRIYGAHWWITDDGRGTFWASGFEGQRIICVPASDLVVVRLGKSSAEAAPDALAAWSEQIISAFDAC